MKHNADKTFRHSENEGEITIKSGNRPEGLPPYGTPVAPPEAPKPAVSPAKTDDHDADDGY